MDTPADVDPVSTARIHALAELADATQMKDASDEALTSAIAAAADLGISLRDIAAAVSAAGVSISHDTVARRIRDWRDTDPDRLYSVGGQMFSARSLPADAPTLRHCDEIAITEWVRVPVDLTAYDPSEDDPAERTASRDRRVTRAYTVDTHGDRPYLGATHEPPGPDAVGLKYGGFAWIGDDLYQLVTDVSLEALRPKLGLVRPRPPKPARDEIRGARTATPDTEETQP